MIPTNVNRATMGRVLGLGALLAALMAAVLLLAASSDATAQPSPDEPPESEESDGTSDPSLLLQKAEQEGSVRAIVGLQTDFTPEGRLSQAQAEDQRDAIQSAGAGLQADLTGTEYQTLREYETVPYIALELTPEAFRAAQDSSHTTTIQEDEAVEAQLAQSSPIVQAPTMWANNYKGYGQTIAVLDTGVDRFHPFLGGRVSEEACFTSSSTCPNGKKSQTGRDSGASCTYAPKGCRHGTIVAGIAAGSGSDFSGVAPNATIMSVQVFSRFTGTSCAGTGEDPCTQSFTSDQIAGLERVYLLRYAHTFAAVNMSLGGGRHFSNCDSDSRKAIIDNLRTAGIATVIASGNDGFTDSVHAPACISSAVAVGSTTKQDTLASDSNMSSMVDLLAPGDGITSSVPGGGFARFNGTSLAAPHVAGAWALLEERDPDQNVLTNLFALQFRSTPIQDTRFGGTETGYRINIADAANVRLRNDDFSSPELLSFSTVGSIKGINIAATRESDEPDHLPTNNVSPGYNSVWYSWTAPKSGPVTFDTCTSSFGNVLAVYTGSAIGSLSQVASDENFACDAPNDSGSKVTFDAVAGTNYRIAVSGYVEEIAANIRGEGNFTLNVAYDPPSNDNFSDAQTLSGNSATVDGTTLAATHEYPNEPDHYTTNPPDSDYFDVQRSVWYSWTAPSSGQVEINTCQTNIDSVLAVYTGSDLSTLNRVTDNRNACPSGVGSKVTFDATEGTTYKIAVGDYGPDPTEDTFTLDVVDKDPPTVESTTPDNNARGVSRQANVEATFSKPMNEHTIDTATFTLKRQGSNTNVAATVSYDADARTATLDPEGKLKAGKTYTVTVTNGVSDLAGNPLDQAKSWKFKVKR